MTTSGEKRGKAETAEIITAWKGFNADLACAGGGSPFQFKVGETYVHKGHVAACLSGFHACENPLDAWSYYGLENGNRFCRVQLSGKIDRHEGDSKIAAERLTVETEVTLGEMIRAGVEYMVKATKGCGDDPSGNSARIGSSGDSVQIGSSGHYAQIGSSGDSARIDVSGQNSAAAAVGPGSIVKAVDGTPIAICEWRDGRPVGFATGIVGKDGIEAGKFYRADGGKLVEVA